MKQGDMIATISKRLPYLKRRDVKDVIEVMVELWGDELARPGGEVSLTRLGKLYVEAHDLRATGIVRQRLLKKFGVTAPRTLRRFVIRFRASQSLRAVLVASYQQEEDGNE